MSPATIVDAIIVVILAFYLFDGYRRGFILLALELIGTWLAFYSAFLFSGPAGQTIQHYTNFPAAAEKPVGFIAVWLIAQTIYVAASTLLYPRIPAAWRESLFNRAGGLIPSMVKGLVMVAVLATLLVVLPIRDSIRPAITQSYIGGTLVVETQRLEQIALRSYSKELTETLTFLTTTPFVKKTTENNETIDLHFKTTDVSTDPASEEKLLKLVNQERLKVGLKALESDPALRAVARAHAKDMLERGYFSHYTPEGKDPFDRLEAAGINYAAAGENLAFAPTVELAHIGLMNSPKHRDNILFPDFGHVGIGVINAGIYGEMFVQEFSD